MSEQTGGETMRFQKGDRVRTIGPKNMALGPLATVVGVRTQRNGRVTIHFDGHSPKTTVSYSTRFLERVDAAAPPAGGTDVG